MQFCAHNPNHKSLSVYVEIYFANRCRFIGILCLQNLVNSFFIRHKQRFFIDMVLPGWYHCHMYQLLQTFPKLGMKLCMSLIVANASNLTPTNMYIARARGEVISTVGRVGLMLADHRQGYWVFSLILDSLVGLSAGVQSAGGSVPETLGSNPACSTGRLLASFRFNITPLLPVYQN